jgi:LysM repeat protein
MPEPRIRRTRPPGARRGLAPQPAPGDAAEETPGGDAPDAGEAQPAAWDVPVDSGVAEPGGGLEAEPEPEPDAEPEPEPEPEPDAEPDPEREGALEPEVEGEHEPDTAEPEPEVEVEPGAALEPEEEREGALELEVEGEHEPEPDAEAEPEPEPVGWFRDEPVIAEHSVEPETEEPILAPDATVIVAPVVPEDVAVRERGRDEDVLHPDERPPRRPSRLRNALVGLVIVVAVGGAGFVAGLMLPALIPGPGISSTTPEPSATASPEPTPPPTPSPTSAPTPSPTSAPTPSPTPEATSVIYVVQPGDSLLAIADKFGVTAAAIRRANDIDDPNLIQVGQRLTIPNPERTPAP